MAFPFQITFGPTAFLLCSRSEYELDLCKLMHKKIPLYPVTRGIHCIKLDLNCFEIEFNPPRNGKRFFSSVPLSFFGFEVTHGDKGANKSSYVKGRIPRKPFPIAE